MLLSMYDLGFSMEYRTPAWAARLQTTSNCSCLNKLSIISWSTRSILENRKELNLELLTSALKIFVASGLKPNSFNRSNFNFGS